MKTLLLSTAAWLALTPVAATAQTQTQTVEPPVQSDAPDEDAAVQDIVVTAQRRSERLQDVPIAVNVASSEQLQSSGIVDLPQLQAIVPGLNVSVANGSFQPSIRGVASASNVVEQPVSLYIDGVYLPQSQEGLRDLSDAEQITTLKGPQGTLFGRNATAGVLQITTFQPSFDSRAQFNVGYGSYRTVRTNAFVTGGLSSNIAASLAGAYQTQGNGWGRSLTTGREENRLDHSFSTRGKLLFELGGSTSLLIIGDYLDRLDSGATFQPYPGTRLAYQGFGPIDSRYDSYNGTAGFTSFKGGGASATLNADLGFAKLVAISAYREARFGFKYDLSGVAQPILITTASGRSRMYSQELQLVSDTGGRFNWLLGAFYFNYRQGYDFFNRDIGTGVSQAGTPYRFSALSRNATLDAFELSESIAPFAQVDFEIAPGTTLTGGLRYTYEERSLNGFSQATNGSGVVLPATRFTPPKLEVSKLTWRFAAEQKLAEDVMIFASYSRGFKSGGFNIATPGAPGYLPEQLDDWELGLKSQFWDRRLTFNITGFYYDYQNVQVTQFGGDPPSQRVTNGAGAEIYGVDVDLSARLADGLTVSGGMELLNPFFTEYPGAQLGVDLPAGGVRIPVGGFDAAGQRVPYARKYVATGAVDLIRPMFGGKVAFNITVAQNSDYYFEPDNVVRQPAYTLLNASVRLTDSSEKLSLRFGVTNALDETIIARNATLALGRLVSYGTPPREYTLTLGARF